MSDVEQQHWMQPPRTAATYARESPPPTISLTDRSHASRRVADYSDFSQPIGPIMEPTVNIPSSTISSSKVEGTKVFALNGDKLGSIEDLVIDKISGQVRYAALEFGGFLGMGTDRYPLPWGALKYDVEKDGYVVNVTKEQLGKAPKYNKDHAPQYTEDFGRDIYDHYGTPWVR